MTTPKTAGAAQGIVCSILPVFAMLGAVLIAPILGVMNKHFADEPNANILVPLLLTAPAFCLAILSPFAGILGNRVGYRPVILISLALYGVLGVAPAFLESMNAIFVSRLLVGIAEAGIVTCCMAIMSHYFVGDARQKWFTISNILMPWTAAIVIAATGFIGSLDWRYTFLSYGLSLVLLVAAFIFLFEPARQSQSEESMSSQKAKLPPVNIVLRIVLIAITGSVAFYIAPVKLAYLLQANGVTSPSVNANILALGLVIGGPIGAVLARLAKHKQVGLVLGAALGGMALGLSIMATGTNNLTIGIGTIIQQMSGGMMLVTAMTYVMSLAAPHERGMFSGLWWFTYTLANFVTPLLLAALLAITGSDSYAILGAAGLVVLVCVWLLVGKPFKQPVVEPGDEVAVGGH